MNPQQPCHGSRFRYRNQQDGLRVGQDADMAADVFFHLGQVRRWINRHGNTAGTQDAHIDGEILRTGRQHDGHCLSRFKPTVLQTCGDPFRCLCQIATGDGLFALFAEMDDLDAVRLPAQMPVDDFE